MNRNRILHPKSGHNYITVPVDKLPQSTPTNEITICQSNWKERIFGQLEAVYKKSAPYYTGTMKLVCDCLGNNYAHLAQINIETTLKVCEFIGLQINYSIFSQMDLKINPVYEPDEWALNIAVAMGYDVYRNAVGGQTFFDRDKYLSNEIRLEFIKNRLHIYDQKREEFIPGLSIIDVLMWNSPKETLELIKDYDVITGEDNVDT